MAHVSLDLRADRRLNEGLTVDTSATDAGSTRVSHWIRRYRFLLLSVDLCAMVAAVLVGFELRFGTLDGLAGADYFLASVVLTIGWSVALMYYGGYEIRHISTGPEELKRLLRASATILSFLAIVCYAFQVPVARGFVVGVVPLGAAFLMLGRAGVRHFVTSLRLRGEWTYRILVVGTPDSVQDLLTITERAKGAGLMVSGVCMEEADVGADFVPGIPVVGGVLDAARCAAETDADVVAVAGAGLGARAVRELGWALEGSNRGLVLAPALTEIAGSRVHVSPVEGLPLVWLEQPRLGRGPRLLKRALDVIVATLALILSLPVLIGTVIAIKLCSPGPVLFRQRRLGTNGVEFWIFKFRSMHAGAEARRDELLELNEQDGAGVLFKIKDDPRVTSVGRWIRKLSIDELPQLWQVLTGTMSLVGPRPLAAEDSVYTGSARRRLLVKPGVTGLWQISGRSQTTWDDAVRLDLYYVENWSLGLDMSILVRTVFAVLGRRGAY